MVAEPRYGVLLAHETDDATLVQQLTKLDEEAANFRLLRGRGYDVPDVAAHSVEVIDHLAGGTKAAALLVEHVDGIGPYKATTEYLSISKIVSKQSEELKKKYLAAWSRLTEAAAETAPMDLQVLLANDGRIVTIDPEKIGPPRKLRPLIR